MFKINRTDEINVDLYDERINHTGFILYDREAIERDVAYYRAHANTCYDLAYIRMMYASGGECRFLDTRSCILNYLMTYEKCPESFFISGKTQGYSLDSKRVLEVLKEHGYAQEFIEHYTEYKSWSAKCSKLDTILKECTEFAGVSCTGKKLYKLPFVASVQTNRRFNYRNFDIISQIPKSMANCISVEDGYFLAWGDFAQSDFRIAYNLFLRSPENDKVFAKYDDKYEALARMLAANAHEDFDYEKFKEERQIYKRNTLATVYGKRSSAVPEDAKFISQFSQFVDQMPAYKAYNEQLNKYNDLGMPLMVQSYFGFVQQIYDGPMSSKDTKRYEALNTPIQTGSSEIVISVVNDILNKCYEQGYTEDDVSLYLVRHDEPIFKIKNSAKGVLKILADHTTVIVDDWTPLKLDWDLGYSYKESDEGLVKEFESVCNDFNETIVTREAICSTAYQPLLPIAIFGVARMKTPDGKTIVTFYDEDRNEVMYSLFNTTDDKETITECKLKFRDAVGIIVSFNINKSVIYSDFLDGSDYFDGEEFEYKCVNSGQVLFHAKRLCQLMTWRYCKKAGLDPGMDKPVFTTYDDWINEVKESQLLIAR